MSTAGRGRRCARLQDERRDRLAEQASPERRLGAPEVALGLDRLHHAGRLRARSGEQLGAVSEFGKNRTLSEKVATRAAILIMAFGLS